MITYFSEQDLVSFGNYLLSPVRKEFYLKQGIEEEKVDSILGAVNNIDLTNWVNLVISSQRQQQEVIMPETEDTQKTEDLPTESPLRIVE